MRLALGLSLLLWLPGAQAQDERRVTSPDGRLEFRISVSQPEVGALYRLGYRLLSGGQPVIDTSYLGILVHNQEPVLCENVGLIGAHSGKSGDFNWLTAEYMQNGSLGRLVKLEIRVWNRGAAFRYVIPRSTPLEELLIDDELTEFDLARTAVKLSSPAPLPFAAQLSGGVWVAIAQARAPGYPRTELIATGPHLLSTHLAPLPDDGGIALESHTPFTTPWRVILLSQNREEASRSAIVAQLNTEK